MGLSRAMLKGMGLTDEQVTAIVEEHTAVLAAIKEERDKYKADAEKLPSIQKELDNLKTSGGDWEKKYNDEHTAFEAYKKDLEDKAKVEAVKNAYKSLLKEAKVGDKHIDSILRVTDFSAMKLDKEGKLTDSDKLAEGIKKDWSGFITTTETKGSDPATPPASNGGNDGHTGRAKELAAQRYAQLYGVKNEGGNK